MALSAATRNALTRRRAMRRDPVRAALSANDNVDVALVQQTYDDHARLQTYLQNLERDVETQRDNVKDAEVNLKIAEGELDYTVREIERVKRDMASFASWLKQWGYEAR